MLADPAQLTLTQNFSTAFPVFLQHDTLTCLGRPCFIEQPFHSAGTECLLRSQHCEKGATQGLGLVLAFTELIVFLGLELFFCTWPSPRW